MFRCPENKNIWKQNRGVENDDVDGPTFSGVLDRLGRGDLDFEKVMIQSTFLEDDDEEDEKEDPERQKNTHRYFWMQF